MPFALVHLFFCSPFAATLAVALRDLSGCKTGVRGTSNLLPIVQLQIEVEAIPIGFLIEIYFQLN